MNKYRNIEISKYRHRAPRGVALVEVVISSAIFLIAVLGITAAFSLSLKASLQNTSKVQATLLAEEGIEAMRAVRDGGWTSKIVPLTAGTSYYLYWTGTNWTSTTTYALVDSTFERKVVLGSVSRDSNQNIVLSGGTNDANTRKVTVTVSWREGTATSTKSLATYLTNIFGN